MRLPFARVVGRINPDVTFCQRSSVGTEVTRLFAEPSLERIGELASRPRPFGAGPQREGLGERASARGPRWGASAGRGAFGLSHEASAQGLGRIGESAETLR